MGIAKIKVKTIFHGTREYIVAKDSSAKEIARSIALVSGHKDGDKFELLDCEGNCLKPGERAREFAVFGGDLFELIATGSIV